VAGIRESAAKTLPLMKDPRAIGPLIAMLDDQNTSVRWWAARGLEDSTDPRAVSALTARLRSHDLLVVEADASFFIRRAVPGSEEVLIEALNKRGNGGLAETLLNSGNGKLENAAFAWTRAHDLMVLPSSGGGVRWGSGR